MTGHVCSGDVVDEKMQLSKMGLIANKYWLEIPNHFPFVKLDKYVIMPNHVHGIIIIDNVGTCHGMSLQQKQNAFSKPIAGSLSIIINHYKGTLMRWCKNNGYAHFQWQPRFYDRIIRDEMELNRTRKYIVDNPAKWKKDRNNVF